MFQILSKISNFVPEMAGIYIHIPFCKSRCIYCGFYSTTSLEFRQRYVEAIVRELEIVSGSEREVSTIYLGGGTPSQLSIPQLKHILNTLYIYNKVATDAEVTIEVNPDDVTPAFADGLRTMPINRVSMGAQTFSDERLRWLHRRHTSQQVTEAIRLLREVGIRNISIDLMYGFPDETLADWKRDIEAALALDVEHISAYCLMVEEGTELYRRYGDMGVREYKNSKEETERAMYELLIDKLSAAGYEHYEISNFAKTGYRSRHNASYWNGSTYIGIGAAAHSYDGHTRSWNISDIHRYIDGMERGERIFDFEVIDDDTHYNDMVTVALRTREGLDLSKLPEKYRTYAIRNAQRFVADGLLVLNGEHLTLTHSGLFLSDMVMRELIFV